MRNLLFVVLSIMVVVLAICSYRASRSKKAIGRSLSMLLLSLIPPIAGNLIIINSTSYLPALIGSYIYFIGMDLIMAMLIKFTIDYCSIKWENKIAISIVYSFFTVDIIQMLLNPVFGHAFKLEQIMVDSLPYFRLIPFAGQTFHRVVVYGEFVAVLIVFLVKLIKAPKIYVERYAIILASMIFSGIWETFYIFSRTPLDTSMIGFGIFGLLVFYFSLYYRPLRLLDRMLAGIASEMHEALYFFDAMSRCIWANGPALKLLGIDNSQLDMVLPKLAESFPLVRNDGDEWQTQQVIGRGSDARFYFLEKHIAIDDNGRKSGSFLSIRDNTDAQRELQNEKYIATHDALTGLFNRSHLYSTVHNIVTSHPEHRYLLVFVDVNDFKIVNDIFGADFGDFALISISKWIQTSMPEAVAYGRLGGDTFGVCIAAADFDADRLSKELMDYTVKQGSIEHHILMHMGVYEIRNPNLDVSVMFDRARLALSTIKDQYQIHVAYYDDDMRKKVLWNQKISSELHTALEQKQIRPFLQPLVNSEGRVVGAEALVRWIHPEEGLLPPISFIPVFEQNGMIVELDKYMWRCACEILAEWKFTHPDLFISVNISPKDFYFMDVEAEFKNIVCEYDIDPSMLRIEITETVMMTDIENRVKILENLKKDGFLVEMDDFGSGYSSLNLLKDMPVDVIKIDMMFLRKSYDNPKARTILRNIITLTDELGIESLTEGVETANQYSILSQMGCKLFQGYYFSKPVPVEEFEKFCDGRTA